MVAVSVGNAEEGGNKCEKGNGKKAWLKYYEWEYMVVWNWSLCMRFQHTLAIF